MIDDLSLERSEVVANSAMNRERGFSGPNSYTRDLAIALLDPLLSRWRARGEAAWLDLCCGSGKALIEGARRLEEHGAVGGVEILGIDLVPMFYAVPEDLAGRVRLLSASLHAWGPQREYDLVTCVHGLHYIGDRLGLIARAVSWLRADGLFIANFDPASCRSPGGASLARQVAADLRRAGVEYCSRRRLIRCAGRKDVSLPYRYLGADDAAGPNYTGQPAVASYYVRV